MEKELYYTNNKLISKLLYLLTYVLVNLRYNGQIDKIILTMWFDVQSELGGGAQLLYFLNGNGALRLKKEMV